MYNKLKIMKIKLNYYSGRYFLFVHFKEKICSLLYILLVDYGYILSIFPLFPLTTLHIFNKVDQLINLKGSSEFINVNV